MEDNAAKEFISVVQNFRVGRELRDGNFQALSAIFLQVHFQADLTRCQIPRLS